MIEKLLILTGAVILVASATGCDPETSRIGWEFEFESDDLRTRAVLVEGTILNGGCTGTSTLYTGLATSTETPPAPPTLGPGTYGFNGRARDASCTWFADGCTEVVVPPQGESTVVVTLAAAAESAACSPTECVDGICGMDVFDAGPDVAPDTATDAPVDAPPADAPCMGDGTACGGGICYGGACCTGCWNGTSCQTGDTAAVCGGGGADCAACDCECTAGTCTAPAVVDVMAGAFYTCAIDTGGALYCWGDNDSGQLGQGTMGIGSELLSPTMVGARTDWSSVGCGDDHVCAVPTDGTLHCWGDNEDGQIGIADLMNRAMPLPVGVDMDWADAELAADGDHGCFLKTDDSLYCMGQNNYGQVGVGTMVDVRTPTQVPGTWAAYSVGHRSTCAIQMDGSLWCWGRNNQGQLGIGSLLNQNTPTRVGTDSDWTAVGFGDEHACAIRGGSLYCWGLNLTGQVGDGTVARRTAPVLIGTDTDWIAADGGIGHTCALKSTGQVFCAGADLDGQLGDGTPGGMSMTFTAVVDIDDADMITAGELHNCARVGDGSIRCWGGNANGALGRGDRVTRPRPVTVCVGP